MLPNKKLITIDNNQELIKELLFDLVLEPRIKALKWSQITKQSPNLKVGYPGQHLASLVVGMVGEKTGARGNDITDGSEVKSCSRIDQLDNCKDCKSKVLRIENSCQNCNSLNINRMDDSKWLFTIRSENDLKVLTQDVDRIILVIADYPAFNERNFEDLRFQFFEIWTKSPRNKHFVTLMTNYYEKIYLEHKKKNSNKTPAPKNFWPYSYQFYMCNPIKILNCIVKNANTKPEINIDYYVSPQTDRNLLASELMPIVLLKQEELKIIASERDVSIEHLKENMPFISEELRLLLTLRDTDKASETTPYQRL